MPTVSRYLRNLLLAAAACLAAILALAHLVEPRTRLMSEPVDSRVIREAGRKPVDIGNRPPPAAPSPQAP